MIDKYTQKILSYPAYVSLNVQEIIKLTNKQGKKFYGYVLYRNLSEKQKNEMKNVYHGRITSIHCRYAPEIYHDVIVIER